MVGGGSCASNICHMIYINLPSNHVFSQLQNTFIILTTNYLNQLIGFQKYIYDSNDNNDRYDKNGNENDNMYKYNPRERTMFYKQQER
jgi:hypothetical protein